MANLNYQILPVPDPDLFEAIQEVWRETGARQDATFTVMLMEGGPRPITGQMPTFAADPQLQAFRDARLSAVKHIALNIPNYSQFAVSVSRRQTNPSTDQVSFNLQDGIDVAVTSKVALAVQQAFKRFDLAPSVESALGPALAEFYRRREADLVEFEALTKRLIEQNVKFRDETDARYAEDRRRLEADFAAQREKLDGQHADRMAELEAKDSALEARRHELDDRDNTHARRQLRADLKEELRNRSASFALSAKTGAKRWPIHALFLAWIGASGTIVARAAFVTAAPTGPSTAGLIELGLSGLSLVGAIAFYIRWNDLWARQHANEEFRMRRLDLDVDRASWAVEVALEWNEEKGSTIPPELLERLTRNLFVDGTQMERARHPAEDLATALLGASAGMKLKSPLGELSVDRKGMRQLHKASASDGSE